MTVIHLRNVHQREFNDVFAGKQLFILFQPYALPAVSGDVVTLRELKDETGDRTGRELVADVMDVMLLDHMQIVGIMPRKFKLILSEKA